MEEKKVLLSIKDLEVKFRVRGRILTAIRGISLDIYENESIAIVGESGSGKSVFTKTFAGMLDSNGFISNGSIVFNDEELAKTDVTLNAAARSAIANIHRSLNESAKLEAGAETYKKIVELKSERSQKTGLSDEEDERFNQEIKDHEVLSSYVRCTSYADGTKVYVNYSFTEDYTAEDGTKVPTRDYVVVR